MSIRAIVAALGMAYIGVWETCTVPAVVILGIALAFVFINPVSIVTSITGIQVTLNFIAELIGGGFITGNVLSMNFSKAFRYITTAQAVYCPTTSTPPTTASSLREQPSGYKSPPPSSQPSSAPMSSTKKCTSTASAPPLLMGFHLLGYQ